MAIYRLKSDAVWNQAWSPSMKRDGDRWITPVGMEKPFEIKVGEPLFLVEVVMAQRKAMGVFIWKEHFVVLLMEIVERWPHPT